MTCQCICRPYAPVSGQARSRTVLPCRRNMRWVPRKGQPAPESFNRTRAREQTAGAADQKQPKGQALACARSRRPRQPRFYVISIRLSEPPPCAARCDRTRANQ